MIYTIEVLLIFFSSLKGLEELCFFGIYLKFTDKQIYDAVIL